MAYSKEYYQQNREVINKKRRDSYSSETRRKDYIMNKESILEKLKHNRKTCNLCRFDFRSSYLKKHLLTRHKLSEEEACIFIENTQNV